MKNKKGFTLAEILVVMVIITVLAALLLPAVRKARAKAFVDKAKAEMANLASIETMVKMDTGWYVRLCDLDTVDTSISGDEPYIYDSDGELRKVDSSTYPDTHIAVWDGPYQVFQEKSVLSSSNGSAASPGGTTWNDNLLNDEDDDFPDGTLLDSWGHPYGLAYNDTEKCMIIYSAGPNGVFETDKGNTTLPIDSDDLLYKFR